MREKIIAVLIAGILSVSLFGTCLAKEAPKLELPESFARVRMEKVRLGEMSTPQFLAEETGFWAGLIERLVSTGNVIEIMDAGVARTGFEMTFYDAQTVDVIFGVVPDDKARWFYGVEWKGFPLLGDLIDLFKRFDPALVVFKGSICFAVSFEWREEEIAKR